MLSANGRPVSLRISLLQSQDHSPQSSDSGNGVEQEQPELIPLPRRTWSAEPFAFVRKLVSLCSYSILLISVPAELIFK